MVGKVGGGARVAEGEFEEVFGGGEEGDVWAVFGYVVGLDFFDGVEADEVEDVGEFGDEEVVGGVEEGFFEEWAVEEVVFVGVGLGEGVFAKEWVMSGQGWQPVMSLVWISHSALVRVRESVVGRVV